MGMFWSKKSSSEEKPAGNGQGPSGNGITPAQVLAALSKVKDPDLHRDLVSLNFIKDLSIEGSKVSFTIELTTPACPVKAKLESEARSAVLAIPGVSEVNVKMTSRVQSAGFGDHSPVPGVKNIIAVGSGKGGVGKSTVAVNLAVALAECGASVGLMDADIYGPSLAMMMGVSSKDLPPSHGNKMIPPVRYGVKLISLGFLLPDTSTPVVWRGPMVGKAVDQLLTDVEWGELDYLVVDLPPGTGDAQLSLAQKVAVSGAVVVTTPQDVALLDVIKAINMFKKVNIPVLGIIENMSYLECPHCHERIDLFKHGGGRRASQQYGIPFLGEISLNPDIPIGGDQGIPIVKSHPDSQQARQFIEIAKAMAAQLSMVNYEKSVLKIIN